MPCKGNHLLGKKLCVLSIVVVVVDSGAVEEAPIPVEIAPTLASCCDIDAGTTNDNNGNSGIPATAMQIFVVATIVNSGAVEKALILVQIVSAPASCCDINVGTTNDNNDNNSILSTVECGYCGGGCSHYYQYWSCKRSPNANRDSVHSS